MTRFVDAIRLILPFFCIGLPIHHVMRRNNMSNVACHVWSSQLPIKYSVANITWTTRLLLAFPMYLASRTRDFFVCGLDLFGLFVQKMDCVRDSKRVARSKERSSGVKRIVITSRSTTTDINIDRHYPTFVIDLHNIPFGRTYEEAGENWANIDKERTCDRLSAFSYPYALQDTMRGKCRGWNGLWWARPLIPPDFQYKTRWRYRSLNRHHATFNSEL